MQEEPLTLYPELQVIATPATHKLLGAAKSLAVGIIRDIVKMISLNTFLSSSIIRRETYKKSL
jgi:hypothetical protein